MWPFKNKKTETDNVDIIIHVRYKQAAPDKWEFVKTTKPIREMFASRLADAVEVREYRIYDAKLFQRGHKSYAEDFDVDKLYSLFNIPKHEEDGVVSKALAEGNVKEINSMDDI